MREEKGQSVDRIKRKENARGIAQMRYAHSCQRKKPNHHDRPKEARHSARPTALHHEQGDQDHKGDRQNIMIKRGRDEFQTFNG